MELSSSMCSTCMVKVETVYDTCSKELFLGKLGLVFGGIK